MRNIEENIQIACVLWFSVTYPQFSLLLHHSPNGGKRNSFEAAKFKRMGTRAGFPDLILLLQNSQYNYLAVELKTNEPNSKQTYAQKQYQQIIETHGGKYVICRSEPEFETAIQVYLNNI